MANGETATSHRFALLPGMDGTGRLFEPFVAQFAPGSEPIVVNYPLVGSQAYRDLLPFAEAALAECDSCVVIAESFSGPLALMLVANEPRRIRAVVLVNSFVTNPRPLLTRLLRSALRTPLGAIRPVGPISRVMLGVRPTRPVHSLFREIVQAVPTSILTERLDSVIDGDVRAQLTSCRAPILYLRGNDDWVVRPRSVAEICTHKPDVVVRKIPGPHLLLQTQPAECLREIQAFLDERSTSYVKCST